MPRYFRITQGASEPVTEVSGAETPEPVRTGIPAEQLGLLGPHDDAGHLKTTIWQACVNGPNFGETGWVRINDDGQAVFIRNAG